MKLLHRFFGAAFALDAAVIAQDQLFLGGPHVADPAYVWGALGATAVLFGLSSDWFVSKVHPRPKLVIGDIGEFWRPARGSRQGADLQVLYARVRNARDGGGEKATIRDAELWMEAYDESGQRVGSANGNWLDLSTGKPFPVTMRRATLKPMKRQEWGLEIAGKFLWASAAWIAGEGDPPSLKPGTYRIRASVADGTAKGKTFQWKVENPGANQRLSASKKRR